MKVNIEKNNALHEMHLQIGGIRYRLVECIEDRIDKNTVLTCCAKFFDLTIVSILNNSSRKVDDVYPRHVAAFMLKKYTNLPHKDIASMFGYKDHSSTVHAIQSISDQISAYTKIRYELERLERFICETGYKK